MLAPLVWTAVLVVVGIGGLGWLLAIYEQRAWDRRVWYASRPKTVQPFPNGIPRYRPKQQLGPDDVQHGRHARHARAGGDR